MKSKTLTTKANSVLSQPQAEAQTVQPGGNRRCPRRRLMNKHLICRCFKKKKKKNTGFCVNMTFSTPLGKYRSHKNLRTDASSSFIHIYQNLEASKISFVGEWVDKLWYNQPTEYYSALKKKWASKLRKYTEMILNAKCSVKEAPPVWLRWRHPGRGKMMETVKQAMLAGSQGKRGINGQSAAGF